MKVYQNIEVVQLNFDSSTDRFYFPENTRLYNKVINDISFFTAPNGMTLNSPFDSMHIIENNKLQNFYVEIVKDSETVLHSRVNARLSDITKGSRLGVECPINQNLCNLTYVGDTADLEGKCILIYFTFDTTVTDEYELSTQQKGISIKTTAPITRLSDLIDQYIAAQGDTVKCIEVEYNNTDPANFFYLDIRDKADRSFRLVPSGRLRISTTTPIGANNIYQKCYLKDYNIDFQNSYILRASGEGEMNVKLIFTY